MNKTDALIIGAGPTGLLTAHQLKLIGLDCEIVDNLDKIGGQCIELYPDKPIYDIPAVPECSGKSLTESLLQQIKPFSSNQHLNERVQEITEKNGSWIVKTNKDKSVTVHITIHIKKLSYKPIIIGKKGENIKKISISARKDLEETLNKKFHLFLYLKTLKNNSIMQNKGKNNDYMG